VYDQDPDRGHALLVSAAAAVSRKGLGVRLITLTSSTHILMMVALLAAVSMAQCSPSNRHGSQAIRTQVAARPIVLLLVRTRP